MLSVLYPIMLPPPPYNFPVVRKSVASHSVSTPISPSRPAAGRSRKRPRGIWKTRQPAAAKAFVNHLTNSASRHHLHRVPISNTDSPSLDEEEGDIFEAFEDDVRSVSTASSSKRRKLDSSSTPSSPNGLTSPSSSAHSAHSLPPSASPPSSPFFYEVLPTRPLMDSLLTVVSSKADKRVCAYGDWEQLKELFAEAAERYERTFPVR
jgi:hypothetical protein